LVRLLPDDYVCGSERATTRADTSSSFCLSRQICRMERRRAGWHGGLVGIVCF
jgi:hypothetical protein